MKLHENAAQTTMLQFRKFSATCAALLLTQLASAQWVEITANIPEVESPPADEVSVQLSGGYIFPIFDWGLGFHELLSTNDRIIAVLYDDVLISDDAGDTFAATGASFADALSPIRFGHLPEKPVIIQTVVHSGEFWVVVSSPDESPQTANLHRLLTDQLAWEPTIPLMPELDPDVHGEINHFAYDAENGIYYLATELMVVSPPVPSLIQHRANGVLLQTYDDPVQEIYVTLWSSSDLETWTELVPQNWTLPPIQTFKAHDGLLVIQPGSVSSETAESQEINSVYTSNANGELWSLSYAPPEEDHLHFSSFTPKVFFESATAEIQSSFPQTTDSFFFDQELGIVTRFRTVSISSEKSTNTWLPISVSQIIQSQDILFAIGVDPLYDGPTFPDSIFVSSNHGATWDTLDTEGLSMTQPELTDGGFLPVYLQGLRLLSKTSTHYFAVSTGEGIFGGRLWRRPVGELDLRPSTQIITQPEHGIGPLGQPVEIFVEGTGFGHLDYQWEKNGAPIHGANQASLRFDSLAADEKGDYSVTISGDLGSVTSRTVRVEPRVEFSSFAASRYPIGLREPEQDGDNDGIANIKEFLFGENNSEDFNSLKVRIRSAPDLGLPFLGDSDYLTIKVRKRIAADQYRVEALAAETIKGLKNNPLGGIPVGNPVIEGDFEIFTFRSPFSSEWTPTGFMQVQVLPSE
jgi:hypothetical protein